MSTPPCTRFSPHLFDSSDPDDHLAARAVCATCPLVMECLSRALDVAAEHSEGNASSRGPDGTWAGLLWRDGKVVTTPAGFGLEVAA